MFGGDDDTAEDSDDSSDGLFDKVSEKAGEAVENLDVENRVTIHFRDDSPPVDCLVVWTVSHGRLVKADFAAIGDEEHTTEERRVYPIDRIEYIEGHKNQLLSNETRNTDYDSELLEKVADATR